MYDQAAHKCLKPFRHEPHYYCFEQGYVVEGDRCVQDHYADLIEYCRAEYQDATLIPGEKCLEKVTVPPENSCPPGYRLTQDGSRCFSKCEYSGKIVYCPVKPYCPDGTMDEDTQQCHIYKSHPVDFTCPIGFKICDAKCVLKYYAERLHSCPDGFEFKRGAELPPVLGVGPAEETCIRCDHAPVQYHCNRGDLQWINSKPVCCL
ncbi:unnamed protein product [Vitrella brassicaformis CCMP3155]|uniref:Oocyst wall protein n=1 Tax=Vitrella brassicaformis (strain CCMP3155) TaxID=1169540 RepID=A0A0G4FB16_VITBC|nr:unnamed protein product [Vitrella brassicaformis CCMP3155]|eukprot:CEM10083.1 unnamed protein product [Vitrella brassicaformis CCMP3155]